MSYLGKFSNEEVYLIVSLPYRVGVWVSSTDDVGGDAADLKEANALRKIIEMKSRDLQTGTFVHEIMQATYARVAEWREWEKNTETVLEDCRKVLDFLARELPQKDIDSFKQNLMRIGFEVAHAFREYDETSSFLQRYILSVKLKIDKIIGFFKGETYISEQLLSISYEEDIALSRLANALQYKRLKN